MYEIYSITGVYSVIINPKKPIDIIDGKIAIVMMTPSRKFSITFSISVLDCFTANFASNQDSFNNGISLRISFLYDWFSYVVFFSTLIGGSFIVYGVR